MEADFYYCLRCWHNTHCKALLSEYLIFDEWMLLHNATVNYDTRSIMFKDEEDYVMFKLKCYGV